jgi:phage gp46-like protein
MTDIALIPVQGDFSADLAVLGGDLQSDQGMNTAIIISLFSDARAGDDDALPQENADRRGWWADAYSPIPGDVTGSKLWLLYRAKQTADVLVSARQYALDALGWMLTDGVAASVDVVATFPQRGWLALGVTVQRPSGPGRLHYDYVWKNA